MLWSLHQDGPSIVNHSLCRALFKTGECEHLEGGDRRCLRACLLVPSALHTLFTQCLQNELLAITALQTLLSHLIPIVTTVLNPLLPVATASAGGSALTSRAHGQITLLPGVTGLKTTLEPSSLASAFLASIFH